MRWIGVEKLLDFSVHCPMPLCRISLRSTEISAGCHGGGTAPCTCAVHTQASEQPQVRMLTAAATTYRRWRPPASRRGRALRLASGGRLRPRHRHRSRLFIPRGPVRDRHEHVLIDIRRPPGRLSRRNLFGRRSSRLLCTLRHQPPVSVQSVRTVSRQHETDPPRVHADG